MIWRDALMNTKFCLKPGERTWSLKTVIKGKRKENLRGPGIGSQRCQFFL
jgi:hypothetical protein